MCCCWILPITFCSPMNPKIFYSLETYKNYNQWRLNLLTQKTSQLFSWPQSSSNIQNSHQHNRLLSGIWVFWSILSCIRSPSSKMQNKLSNLMATTQRKIMRNSNTWKKLSTTWSTLINLWDPPLKTPGQGLWLVCTNDWILKNNIDNFYYL